MFDKHNIKKSKDFSKMVKIILESDSVLLFRCDILVWRVK